MKEMLREQAKEIRFVRIGIEENVKSSKRLEKILYESIDKNQRLIIHVAGKLDEIKSEIMKKEENMLYFQYVDKMNSLELSFLKNEIEQEDYVRMLKSYSKAYAQIGGSKVANLQLAKNLECLPEELEKFKEEMSRKKNAEGMGEN